MCSYLYVWIWQCHSRSGVTEQTDKQAAGLASAATRLSRHTTRQGAAYHRTHTANTQWELSLLHHAPAAAAMWNIHTGTKGRTRGRGKGEPGRWGQIQERVEESLNIRSNIKYWKLLEILYNSKSHVGRLSQKHCCNLIFPRKSCQMVL